MLYLILGLDKEKINKEVSKISGGKAVLKMDAFSWDADLVRGKVGGMSLFGDSGEDDSATVFNKISESEENFESLKGLSLGMAESTSKFIVVEGDLNKEEINFFKKSGGEIVEFEEKKKEAFYDFSPFALQDAVGEKSAKRAWIEYIKLRNMGIEEEEIVPKIIQKARDMLAISSGAGKEALSIKSDYPYNKSKRDAKNWPLENLKAFYSKLVSIYHESRMGGEELEVALERELLKI